MSCAVTSRSGLACRRPLIDCSCLLRYPSRLGQASTHRPLPQRLHDQGPGVEGLGQHPFPFQLRLRDHPRPKADLQLADVHSGLHATGEARKRGEESLGVVLLPKPRLDVDSDTANFVHEVALLRHQIPQAVSDLPKAHLQGIQLLLEL